MPLISQIVEAMQAAQEAGHKVLAFVVPVTEDALHNSGLAMATIEDRVQNALIAEMHACLGEDHLARTDEEQALPLWPISLDEMEEVLACLKRRLPIGSDHHMLSTSERRRKDVLERLGSLYLAKREGLVH